MRKRLFSILSAAALALGAAGCCGGADVPPAQTARTTGTSLSDRWETTAEGEEASRRTGTTSYAPTLGQTTGPEDAAAETSSGITTASKTEEGGGNTTQGPSGDPADFSIDRSRISSLVVRQLTSNPTEGLKAGQKAIVSPAAIEKILDLFENAVKTPLPDDYQSLPGTVMTVSCEEAGFAFSLESGGSPLRYRGRYYAVDSDLWHSLFAIYRQADEPEEPPTWD